MYRDLLERLYTQDYLQGVESFINFVLFNMNNISANKIRCLCVKYENNKFHHKNIVMMHLLKKGSSRNTYVDLHTKNSVKSYAFIVRSIIQYK
jgi:predicted GNAT superfamily acetyltransferase